MSNITDEQFISILTFCTTTKVSEKETLLEYIAKNEDIILPVKFRVMLINLFETFNDKLKDEIIAKLRRYYENYKDEEFQKIPKKKTYLFTVRESMRYNERTELYDVYQLGKDVIVDSSRCKTMSEHMISIENYPDLIEFYNYWKSGSDDVCPCVYTDEDGDYRKNNANVMCLFNCSYCSKSKNDKHKYYNDWVIEKYSLPVCSYYEGYLDFELYKLDLIRKDLLREMELARQI